MRLALQLGRANVDAMLRELTAEQFAEWAAFFGLEPWGFHEENRRMAVVASTVANMSGKKVKRPVPVTDFMPKDSSEQEEPVDVVESIKRRFGYYGKKGAAGGDPR